MKAIDRRFSKFLANLITDMVVAVVFFVLTLLFFKFCLWLSFYRKLGLGSNWAGFGCMAGIYLIIAIILILLKLIRCSNQSLNLLIRKFFQ